MSYEFKKLSAVDVIETANDNAKVLIEQNGSIKRVPKDEICGSCSWNDLKDRPFGVETAEITVNVVERAELPGFRPFAVGDTVTVKVNGVEHILVAFDADVPAIGDDPAVLFDGGSGSYGWCIGYLDGVCMCICPNGCTVSYMGETVKQIDPKYIPSGSGGSGGGGYDAIIRYNDLNFTTPELLSGSYDNIVAKVRGGEFVNVLIYGTDNSYNVNPVRILNIMADWDESFYVRITFKHLEVDTEYTCSILSNGSVT